MELIKGIGGTSGGGGGSGTVTSVSVVSANGFAGTVVTSTTTPAITLTTTVTGMLKGNGTAISGVTGTINEIAYWSDANTIGSLTTTTYPSLTELGYLKGVTSSIQTQLNAKGVGNVTKVGTPVDNQVGVWTGDGTIEGAAGLTYDGTLLTSTATTEQLRLAYDSSNFFSTNVASTGQTTFEITGSAKYFRYTTGGASLPTIDSETIATFTKTTGASSNAQISIISGTTGNAVIRFGDTASEGRGQIRYNNNTDGFELYTSAAVKAYLSSTGNFGVGVSPTHRLDSYLSSSSTGVSSIYGLRDIPSGTISSGSSINGVQGQLTVSGSSTISTITATGGNFIAEHDGSSTVHALIGLRGWARTNAASTGVLASAYSFYAAAPANSQAGNTITNAYSLYIESPTAGATLNYGLYQDGSANNYFGGAVGVGSIPAAKLHSLSTTEQLRVGYDASNYYSTTVGSTGGVTFDAVGAGALFTFSDDVRVTTAGTNTASVVTVGGTQTLTNKTLTNPDIDVGSDATGDIYYRDAAGEFTRLGIQASTYALHGGTVPAWETDYALTFGYQLSTSVATGDITVTLLNYLGTTPSTTTPVRFMVGSTLVTYTSATTLTINNDSFYHFNAGSAQLATYEVDYFVYVASSGGLCVSRLPWYTNFAQGGANQEAFLANGGGFSTQDLVNIGRYNATKASGTTGNWSIPATSIIINKPIYYTRALSFTPTLQGSGGSIGTMTASPYTGTYTVRDSACFYRLNVQCTNVGSWSGNVELNLPWINKNEMGDSPVTGWVCPSGANPATASRAVPYTVANSNLQRHLSGVDTANLSWGTFVVNDRIRAEGFYNIV